MNTQEHLLQLLLGHLSCFDCRKTQGGSYRFACPYCQLSHEIPKHKHKGYLYKSKYHSNAFNFKCHKCGVHRSLLQFIKENAPEVLVLSPGFIEKISESNEDKKQVNGKVTKLPRETSISDSLWRSRNLPRHLYRGNPRIIKDN